MKLLLAAILLINFVSEHGCVSQLPQKAHAGIKLGCVNGVCSGPEIKCKELISESGDGCNTCTYTVCTDGKEQWDSGHSSCTANFCLKKKPYDKKLWEKE